MKHSKNCLWCDTTFYKRVNESHKDWRTRHKFCSRSCAMKYRKKYKQVGIDTQFKEGCKAIHPIKKGQHLSQATELKKGHTSWNKGLKGVMPAPWNKGTHGLMPSGAKHPNWRGGVSKLYHLVRSLPEYKRWRKAVFDRDNYTCQFCDKRGVYLHADHIKPFSLIFRDNKISSVEEAIKCAELWDTSNGRTLCKKCHKQTDTYGKRVYKLLTA